MHTLPKCRIFANEERDSLTNGALWIADVNPMGKVLHRQKTVKEILSLMQDALNNDEPFGLPRIFYPEKQIASERAKNQDGGQ
jgi:hypothetical protein